MPERRGSTKRPGACLVHIEHTPGAERHKEEACIATRCREDVQKSHAFCAKIKDPLAHLCERVFGMTITAGLLGKAAEHVAHHA